MKALLFATSLVCFAGGGVVGSMIASPSHEPPEDRSRATLDQCIKVVQNTKSDLATCVKVTNNLVDLTNQFMADLWSMPVDDLVVLRKTAQPRPLPKLESHE